MASTWVDPEDRAEEDIITEAIWDQEIQANTQYLKDRIQGASFKRVSNTTSMTELGAIILPAGEWGVNGALMVRGALIIYTENATTSWNDALDLKFNGAILFTMDSRRVQNSYFLQHFTWFITNIASLSAQHHALLTTQELGIAANTPPDLGSMDGSLDVTNDGLQEAIAGQITAVSTESDIVLSVEFQPDIASASTWAQLIGLHVTGPHYFGA